MNRWVVLQWFAKRLVLMLRLLQRCVEGPGSQSDGETDPEVWGLRGSHADGPVPHAPPHHGLGLQGDVPGASDRTQLSAGPPAEVRARFKMGALNILG